MGNKTRVRTFAATIACGAAMMSLGAGVGDAAASSAASGQASAVTGTSAQLNGTVDPAGIPTFWAFQYGTSTTYGQVSAPVGPLTATSPMSVSTLITSLQPSTTYHFRVVAFQGAAGVSGNALGFAGNDGTFRTLASASSSTSSRGDSKAKASLRSRTLVVRHGAALIRWGCAGPPGTLCTGTISLSARGKMNGKLTSVRCGVGHLSTSAGKHRTVRAALRHRCLTLVKAASRHRLRASLRAVFSQGAGNLKTKVTLAG